MREVHRDAVFGGAKNPGGWDSDRAMGSALVSGYGREASGESERTLKTTPGREGPFTETKKQIWGWLRMWSWED